MEKDFEKVKNVFLRSGSFVLDKFE